MRTYPSRVSRSPFKFKMEDPVWEYAFFQFDVRDALEVVTPARSVSWRIVLT